MIYYKMISKNYNTNHTNNNNYNITIRTHLILYYNNMYKNK